MNANIVITDKILVIAPHADDESIGCGGLLALYGPQCDLLLLTDGRKGHTKSEYSDENKLVEIRKKEFTAVGRIAKVRNIFFLNIEDGKMAQKRAELMRINIKSYDYIFVPNRYESHLDHKVVYGIVNKMKKLQKAKANIYEYEVWTPLRHPTWFLPITSVYEVKKRMIAQHISQLADIDYVSKGMALSCYRGAFINEEYAEAYAFADYSGLKKMIYGMLPKYMKNIIKKRLYKH